MLILSISVTFNVTCLTVTSLITKSCQEPWPIHFYSFCKVVHQQIWGMVVDFRVCLVTVNLCLQQWKNFWNRTMKSVQFLTHSVHYASLNQPAKQFKCFRVKLLTQWHFRAELSTFFCCISSAFLAEVICKNTTSITPFFALPSRSKQ